MLLNDLLLERVNLNFTGSNRVIDMRANTKLQTHIALTKDGGAFLYNWGENWKEVYNAVESQLDTTVQSDMAAIRTNSKGLLIDAQRGYTWAGQRNRYSRDTKEIIHRLLDLGIITPRTQIYFGNWAKRDNDGTLIGSAAQIMKAAETPNKLVLYHGTSNARYQQIMKTGLAALDTDERIWSRDKNMPEHRSDSVYLAATISLASYYADKAIRVDKKRITARYLVDLESKIMRLYTTLRTQRDYRNFDGMHETQIKIEKLNRAKELVSRMRESVGKLEPVILAIEIPRSEYKRLMADDDYLGKMKAKGHPADPTDWRDSLSDFGQVAYRGRIDPDRITRLS